MKKIFTIAFSLFLLNTFAQETKKVLFLGNSYTAGNNLSGLIQNLAQANGDILIKDQNTPGGYTFNAHSSNNTSLNKIASNNWDYVVLQAQSQEPSFPPGQVAVDTKPYAAILNDSIVSNNTCTETMFFMTWGRKNGDQSNCANYAPLCTYDGMQQRLRQSYLEMAVENNAAVAPVGMAWKKTRADFPAIELYTADESHPNINGSYLAACVFYTSIYHKTAVGNSFTSSLDSLTAFRLQTIASNTVLDSLDTWRIDTAAAVPITTDSLITACISAEVNGITFTADTSFTDTISGNLCKAEVINYEIDINDEDVKIVSIFQNILLAGSSSASINLSFEIINYDSVTISVSGIELEKYYPSHGNFFNFEYNCEDNESEVFFQIRAINSPCNDTTVNFKAICQTTGIKTINASSWNISPNPTSNFIEINSLNNEKFVSSIIDIAGREIVSKTNAQKLDMSRMEKGIYFLVIYNEKGEAIGQKKIIKN